MFKKILIANRGDQPRSGAATQLNGMARAACTGDFDAESNHV
jgi:acetyl/propionyl-CoA carboxylase alpha subunit